jgi:outer membrane protein
MTIQPKSSLLELGLAIIVGTPILSVAQATAAVTTPAAVPAKIAFVNLQEAVVACNEGKQDAAALQQRFSSKQAALKAKDDELKKLKDDFQVVSAKLNDEERNARLRVIQDKQKAFERSYADYQAETQEAQQDAVNKIVKKMLPVLEKYVTANGYTAVFDVSNPQTPVLWARKDAMITRQLVDAYNAQTAATPPVAPAPSGNAAPPKP